MVLGPGIQLIQKLHRTRVLQDLGDLDAGADELQDVAVVFQWPTLVLGCVSHL